MNPRPDPAAVALVAELVRRDVKLRIDGDGVRFRPATKVTPDLRALLVRHKADVIRLLRERDEVLQAVVDADRQAATAPTWPSADRLADLPVGVADLARSRPGWTPAAWRDRLRQLADRCERDHADRAADLRQAADALTPDKNFRQPT